MGHSEQLGFFRLVEEANRQLIEGGRVLELGSYDVNGSVREIYAGSREYIGVDLRSGPGVERGRPEHGTRRTDRESPGTQAQGLDYYRNLTGKTSPRGSSSRPCSAAGPSGTSRQPSTSTSRGCGSRLAATSLWPRACQDSGTWSPCEA